MSRIVRGSLGYVQVSVAGTAKSGTAIGIPTGAERVLIIPETNAIRWRDDGGTPTASVGMPAAAASGTDFDGNIANLSLIAQSGTATVNLSYYGSGAFNA